MPSEHEGSTWYVAMSWLGKPGFPFRVMESQPLSPRFDRSYVHPSRPPRLLCSRTALAARFSGLAGAVLLAIVRPSCT